MLVVNETLFFCLENIKRRNWLFNKYIKLTLLRNLDSFVHLIMIHVIMLFFSIHKTSFFLLFIKTFFIDASLTIYQLFILSINVLVRKLYSNGLNSQFISASQRFFENEGHWFQRIKKKHIIKSFDELNNLLFSFFSRDNKLFINFGMNFEFDD